MIVLLAVKIDEAEVDKIYAGEATPDDRTKALVDCARTKPIYRHWEISDIYEYSVDVALCEF